MNKFTDLIFLEGKELSIRALDVCKKEARVEINYRYC